VGHVTRMGDLRNACKTFVGKPQGKIPLRRPRRRWEDNTEIDLREIDGNLWNGFIRHRIGASGELL